MFTPTKRNDNLYDILEVSLDASQQEIRESYLRLKATYSKESMALYSLLDKVETENLIEEIERAYLTLSHPEKRRQYNLAQQSDSCSSDLQSIDTFQPLSDDRKKNPKVISIDRTPPMEDLSSNEELLNPPKTEILNIEAQDREERFLPSQDRPRAQPLSPNTMEQSSKKRRLEELERRIEQEVEWRGDFLRKIREGREISIEEMAEHTKIRKSYLKSIEGEEYSKLPAAVFLRGFLIQIAKKLHLPEDKVSATYLARFRDFRNTKGKEQKEN